MFSTACGKSYDEKDLKKFFIDLPSELQCIALDWGLDDTVFYKSVHTCIKKGKI